MAARCVLLIDDEDDIREVAQLCLEIVGKFDVLTASSGAEGIERAAASQPDAILLDVMMPEMDGPATFWGLRSNPSTRHIPVVLFTAKTFDSAYERKGMEDLSVISKPFDPMQLSGQVASALGWSA